MRKKEELERQSTFSASYGPLSTLSGNVQSDFQQLLNKIAQPEHIGWNRSKTESYFEADEEHLFIPSSPTVFSFVMNGSIAILLTPIVLLAVSQIGTPIAEGRWAALGFGLLTIGILIWFTFTLTRAFLRQFQYYKAECKNPRAGMYVMKDCILIRGEENHLSTDDVEYPYQYIPKAAIQEVIRKRIRGRKAASIKEFVVLVLYPNQGNLPLEMIVADHLHSPKGKDLLSYLQKWYAQDENNTVN